MQAAEAVLQQASLLATHRQDSRRASFNLQWSSGDDDTAVLQTLEHMSRIIERTACDQVVQRAAAQAIADCGSSPSRTDLAGAVWAYVRSRVRFVQDEDLASGAREVLIEPPLLLTMEQPRGDCDDFTMAVASLLCALGVPVRVMAVAANPDDPQRFSHVYAAAVLENRSTLPLTLPIDASHGPYPGWEAPLIFRRMPWRILAPASCGSPGGPPPVNGVAMAAIGAAGIAFAFWFVKRYA